MNQSDPKKPVWTAICAQAALRSVGIDILLRWLTPARNHLATVGVTLHDNSENAVDFPGLARGLAELMVADAHGRICLPEPVWESLWVIGGLSNLDLLPEILDSLGAEGVFLQSRGKPQPADAAVRLWLADRKRAIRIYNRHHDEEPGYHPIDEERLEEEGRTVASEVLRLGPNQAFLYWQNMADRIAHCPNMGRAYELKLRAELDALREWFEDLGHWRDLRPKSKELDPDDHNAHAKHQKQIEDFMAARQSRLRPIEYDEARKAHKCQHEGTEHEDVEYNWEFFRDGVSQLIVRTAGGNVLPPHLDPLKRQYFKNTPPSGYAILESGEKLDGTVFFPNGDSYGFDPCFGDANRFYPEELFRAGDYELRKVGMKGTTLEAVHAVAQEIKQLASPLPGAIANIGKGVEAVRLNTEAIAKNEYELRQENAELRELAKNGFLRFANRVEADDFRAFAAIMLTGNRNQAAQALDIPQRSFYDLVETWLSRGPDYKRMYRMVDWRKKSGRKIKVRLDDSLLGTEVEDQAENPETSRDVLAAMRDKTDTKSRDDLLRDILQAMNRQNAQSWPHIQSEVIGLLKEELSQ